MPYIELRNLTKKYGRVTAVQAFDLDIDESRLVSLLGPSGCGKTTTLRMIAGLIEPTLGEISIRGRILSSDSIFVPPEKRNIGMVFQSYAVWPHMNVFNNIAYPLKVQKKSRGEIKGRMDRVLDLVKLKDCSSRMPHELSGGQQQRVALARALVMEPMVLLLDEPVSNLDAKLREEMCYEIKDLQRRLSMTIIYVTHDQSEAMAMSDVIVVMKEGVVQQIGNPREIYNQPKNRFVADFIGQTNFLPGIVKSGKDGRCCVEVHGIGDMECFCSLQEGTHVTVGIRYMDIELFHSPDSCITVGSATFRGDKTDYILKLGERSIRTTQPADGEYKEGDKVGVKVKYISVFKE